MISNSLLGLTSISQWALFIGIGLILFGWIDKKERIVLAGQFTFLALGCLACWILITDGIFIPEATGTGIPKELKVLTYFKGVAIFAAVDVASLLLKLFNLRFQKTSVYILVFYGLALFFMVFNIQQMAN
jgi:hypothetical protein